MLLAETSAGVRAERTNARHNNFNKLQRCYKRQEEVIDAFFDLANTIITVPINGGGGLLR